MNIALENAEEWAASGAKQTYGDVFIRGNNGRPPRTPAMPYLG